jgi:hemolysin activation/secretion protein
MLGRGVRGIALSIALATAWQMSITAALAQEPGPLPDRPSSRELETPQYLPPEPAPMFELPPVEPPGAPAQPQGPELAIKSFVFEGNQVISTAVLQELAAPLAGREVSLAELEELRQKISRYYVEHGYINSGALLPPGFYRDGVVHVRIVEGRIDELRTNGLDRLRESYLRERLLRPDEPFNVNALQERFQLLLTDPLFAKVNARLQPGAQPGAAILDVDVTRARPWDLSLFLNNYQPPSTGSEAVGFSGVIRNLTGFGDTFDATCQQGLDRGGRCVLGWNIPVAYRTDIHVRSDHGESSVLEEPVNSLDVGSILDSYEVGVTRALVDSIRQRFSLGLLFTHRENATTLLGQPFSFVPGETTGTSRVDAWRFEQDFVQRWEDQTVAFRSTFTYGDTNVDPNATPGATVPAKYYYAWLGQAQFTRRVMDNGANVFLRGTLQWTDRPLVPLEQIAVGGVNSVRGYRENQLVRDQGYFFNLEFRYPLFDRPGDRHRLVLIPFFDFGEAWNTGQDRERLSSVGLGLSYQYQRLFADFFYGKALLKPTVETSGNLQDEGIHFQVRYEF